MAGSSRSRPRPSGFRSAATSWTSCWSWRRRESNRSLRRSRRRSMHLVADLSLGWGDTLWRLAAAAVLGGAIGLERELDEKAAGLRTHMLVSVGAALFTLVG